MLIICITPQIYYNSAAKQLCTLLRLRVDIISCFQALLISVLRFPIMLQLRPKFVY